MATPRVEPGADNHLPKVRRVLHIVESDGGYEGPMACALRECRIETHTCHDVYLALAKLGRTNRENYDAVVLCVDFLAEGEFEFLSLADRHRDGVSLLVYTITGSRSRIRNAVSRGATHVVEADADSIRRALETPLRRRTNKNLAEESRPRSEKRIPTEQTTIYAGHGASDDTPPPKEVGHPVLDESEPVLDGDGVTRSAVARRAPEPALTPDEAGPVEAIADRDEGPLLTPEEAEWLIYGRDGRDDSAAVTKGAV